MTDHHQNPFMEQEIDLREYFRILYEKRWVIISFTVILCTIALLRSFMMAPVYSATTRVLIQKEAPKIVNMQEVAPEIYTGREYYQTQYKILKSRVLAERVNKEIGGYKPWDKWTGRKIKRKKKAKPLTQEDRIDALLRNVNIKPIPNTQLVNLDVEDVDPVLAAKIANLWAEEYISYILDTKFNASQYASTWLNEKIVEARERLQQSEIALQGYRRENKVVIDSEGQEVSMFDSLLQKRSELEIELSEKLEYFKEKHPEIIGIRSELASVETKLMVEREKKLKTGEKDIKYNMLKREVAMNRDIYKSLLNRIGETEVTGELKTTNVRVIDKAIIAKKPVKPSKKRNLLMAFFLGIIGGSAMAFLFESLDQSVKTPEDIKKYIKLPVLVSIALPKGKDGKDGKEGKDGKDGKEGKEGKDDDLSPEFITLKNPRSTIAESYKSLRTSVMFTAVEHKRKTLLLTSSGPQEGKTTTAINLAIVMAQSGEKTVLIDADLRKPRISKTFNIVDKGGLTEILVGSKGIEEVLHTTNIDNLNVITCGSIPPNPSELLGSTKMDMLLAELGDKFDRIIIDTAPVLAVTDAVVLSGKVDGTIVVVKAGETHRHAVSKTKEILEAVSATNLIGTVLNMVETSRAGGYYYYHYYGKYSKYYGHEDEAGSGKQQVA